VRPFYFKNVTNGPVTVTATWAHPDTFREITVHEVSGADTTAPLENTGGTGQVQPNLADATDAATSGSFTTATNGDYIYGAVIVSAGAGDAAAGTSFTQREHSVNDHTTEDRIQSAAGSVAATFTTSGGGGNSYYITVMMAFKPAAAAADPLLGAFMIG
jgi:hypothetical protein